MILYLFFTIAIGYELQKLLQFNFFYRFTNLANNYAKGLKRVTKLETKWKALRNAVLKIVFFDLAYMVFLLIGVIFYSYNLYFFFPIIVLSFVQKYFYRVKNKTFKKIYFTFDIVASIILLALIVINGIYFQLPAVEFIKHLISLV
jgi:hypothetical protein